MSWKKKLMIGVVLAGTAFTVGCENEESNNLAKAQDCLDKITDANYSTADTCLSFIAKYDSQQANILKCSIHLVDGGLTTSKVMQAYKSLSDNTYTDKEAAYISVLALETGKAAAAKPFCESSQLKGLIYISNLSVLASAMADTLAGIGYDPTDPTDMPTQGEIDTMLANCQPGGASIPPCDTAAIGESVISVGSSYCTTSNSDNEICQQISDAIANGGGDPAVVAKRLMCTLNGKTYQAVPEACI